MCLLEIDKIKRRWIRLLNKNDLKDRMLVITIKSSRRTYVGQVQQERKI